MARLFQLTVQATMPAFVEKRQMGVTIRGLLQSLNAPILSCLRPDINIFHECFPLEVIDINNGNRNNNTSQSCRSRSAWSTTPSGTQPNQLQKEYPFLSVSNQQIQCKTC